MSSSLPVHGANGVDNSNQLMDDDEVSEVEWQPQQQRQPDMELHDSPQSVNAEEDNGSSYMDEEEEDPQARAQPAQAAQTLIGVVMTRAERFMSGSSGSGSTPASGSGSAPGNDMRTIRSMPDYEEAHMKNPHRVKIPSFRPGDMRDHSARWISGEDAFEVLRRGFRPVRTTKITVCATLLACSGKNFREWSTPHKNVQRARWIAALCSLQFAGMSRGLLSGNNHEEIVREPRRVADGNGGRGAGGGGTGGGGNGAPATASEATPERPLRVSKYTMCHPDNPKLSAPQVVICLRENYDETLTQFVSLDVFKCVFDPEHSDSELQAAVMKHNKTTQLHSRLSTELAGRRKDMHVKEQREIRSIVGGGVGAARLEDNAGMMCATITDETQLLQALAAYGGQTIHGHPRPVCDFTRLPECILSQSLRPADSGVGTGGEEGLAPEYMLNARRSLSWMAGRVHAETLEPHAQHPDYDDQTLLFSAEGDILVTDVDRKTGGFHICIDPYAMTPFDLPMPRQMHTTAKVGGELIALFLEHEREQEQASGQAMCSAATPVERFQLFMEGDAAQAGGASCSTAAVVAYDTIGLQESERRELRTGSLLGSSSSPGERFVQQPRERLREIARETNRVHKELVEPWKKKRATLREPLQEALDNMNVDVGVDVDADAHAEIDWAADLAAEREGELSKELEDYDGATQMRHYKLMKELCLLHIGRIDAAFKSQVDRDTIPEGYKAMQVGLQTELDKNPYGSASMAFVHDHQLVADDISPFAHFFYANGELFTKDCFIESRSREIMDDIFLHFFEQYADVTFLLLLVGRKGTGKTLRTERMMYLMPEGWTVMAGPSSVRNACTFEHSHSHMTLRNCSRVLSAGKRGHERPE